MEANDEDIDVSRFGDGLRAIRDPNFLASEKWREQQHRANKRGAYVGILDFERLMIARMRRIGVPMFAHCIVRTPEEQRQLYVRGYSRILKDGPHVAGFAVDIVHSKRGWDIPDVCWKIIGHVGKEVAAANSIDIEWGGDWSRFPDPAHWQMRNWKALRASLKARGEYEGG